MGSLKDELAKAGFRSTKRENERERLPSKKDVKKSVKHQMQRNFCEVCERTLPDVELYKHRNPTTDAQWICVACADELMIHDKFRKSAQSDMSVRKMFKRSYGETLEVQPKFQRSPRN